MAAGQLRRFSLFIKNNELKLKLFPKWAPLQRFFNTQICNHHHVISRRASTSISTTDFPELNTSLLGLKSHDDLYKYSLTNPDEFWATIARSNLHWYEDFDKTSDCDFASGKIKWFLGGKLNAAYNCVDRHYKATPDNVALIWEKDEPGSHQFFTYRELYDLVNRMANLLLNTGVRKGDRVALYLPMSPMAVASMLACARIGAIHSVVFAGFSAESLAGRINDAQAETVITADQGLRGGRIIELKKVVDEAVKSCPSVRQVLVSQRTGNDVPMGPKDVLLEPVEEGSCPSVRQVLVSQRSGNVTMRPRDVLLELALANQPTECKSVSLDSEDYLFILYTSGSTGKPKGLAHSIGGYLTYAATTFKHVFDYQAGERFACVADVGWITGHTYAVYGPLAVGATSLLFESTPVYPDPGRYWEMTERLKLNHMYLSPTSLRLLLKSGDSWVTKYDRSSLRQLGCVGEPLNSEAWSWYHSVVGEGRCDIIDTWWQTETGGTCIAPRPSSPAATIKPAMPMRPFYGIDLLLMNDDGGEIKGNDVSGTLCIRNPWPGLTRTVWGDHKRYIDTYFSQYPGYYMCGDGAYRDPDGHYQITGRVDDVINVSGHRLGTAEIEDALCTHHSVAEAAVVGFPDDIKGEGIYAYVVLRDSDQLEDEDIICTQLQNVVKQKIAKYAVPHVIQLSPGLPRTRSGKIMRRILRKVAAGQQDQLGDISTLNDPSVVDGIVRKYAQLKMQMAQTSRQG